MDTFKLSYIYNNRLYVLENEENEHCSLKIDRTYDGLNIVINPKIILVLKSFSYTIEHQYDKRNQIYCNGYQSWTDSFIYDLKDHFRDSNKIIKPLNKHFAFNMYGDSTFKKYQKNVLHAFTYSYILGPNEMFIGSLNEHNNYLIINHYHKENKLVLEADVNGLCIKNTYSLINCMLVNDQKKGLEVYLNNYKSLSDKVLKGYTSWYNHYQDINEDKILIALNALSNEEYDLFQIDDGYETYVGDWLNIDKVKFPNGLDDIVLKIKEKGFIPGIWLAPFVAEKKSVLFNTHPEWFVKDKYGNFIKCGGNWSGFYALDFKLDEVKNYIKKCLLYYVSKGFEFFKLDFLYAVSYGADYEYTRASIASDAYKFLRDVLKDKLILGCGATLAQSFSVFDYLRIGPDVSLIFDDVFYMRMFHRERISTKVTLQNTIYRSHLNKRVFLNDPDVYVLRDNNIKLTKEQKEALLTINILFGSLFLTSDNLNEVSIEYKKLYLDLLNIKDQIKETNYKKVKNIIKCSFILNNNQIISFDYYVKKGILKWIELPKFSIIK